MTRERLEMFANQVASFGVTGDDLRTYGAMEALNLQLDAMDEAYGKDAETFYLKEKSILGILKQISFVKKRGTL